MSKENKANKTSTRKYNPWKIVLSHLGKHFYLGIAIGLLILILALFVLPFATYSVDNTVEGVHTVYDVTFTGYDLTFGQDIYLPDRLVDGVVTPATEVVDINGGLMATFIFVLLSLFFIGYVYVKEETYSLAFLSAVLSFASSFFCFFTLQLSGFSDSYSSNSETGLEINQNYSLQPAAIIIGVLFLFVTALIFIDYFLVYVPAKEDNTFVTYKKELVDNDILLSVRHLKMFFPLKNHKKQKAVHDVSFDIKKGECFGLVGESGCGKTTTGRSIIRLYHITSGSVYFKGYRIAAGSRWNEKEIKWSRVHTKNKIKALREQEANDLENVDNVSVEGKAETAQIKAQYNAQIKKLSKDEKTWVKIQKDKIRQIKYDNTHVNPKLMSKMQMIFQDPIDSLDPRMTVEDIIQEGLKIQGQRNRRQNHKKACEVLEEVGLIADYCSRYPNEFSGGQRQRIGIARAIVMNPEFMICDEPISALDVSIRAQIINLLNDLKENHGLTLMFIAHDLSVVKYFCDRIAVMYYGELVEMASSDELFAHPLHPYTRALLSAIPKPDPYYEKKRKRLIYNPAKEHDYSTEKPKFQEILPGHWVLANSAEMTKYKAMIAEDDVKNAQEEAERKAKGLEY